MPLITIAPEHLRDLFTAPDRASLYVDPEGNTLITDSPEAAQGHLIVTTRAALVENLRVNDSYESLAREHSSLARRRLGQLPLVDVADGDTHRVVVQDDPAGAMRLVASGSRESCERALDAYIGEHPLGIAQTALVLEVVRVATNPVRAPRRALATLTEGIGDEAYEEAVDELTRALDELEAVKTAWAAAQDPDDVVGRLGTILGETAE